MFEKYVSVVTTADDADYIHGLREQSDGYVRELTVVRNDGEIMSSSVPEAEGKNVFEGKSDFFKMASEMLRYISEDVKELENNGEAFSHTGISNSHMPVSSIDGKNRLRYYAITISDFSGVILYGIGDDYYENCLDNEIHYVAVNRHIGHEGYIVSFNKSDLVISGPVEKGINGDKFAYPDILTKADDSKTFEMANTNEYQLKSEEYPVYYSNGLENIFGVDSYYAVSKCGNGYLVAIYPKSEADESMLTTLLFTVVMELLVFAVLLVIVLIIVKRIVINDILKISTTLNSITQGDLDDNTLGFLIADVSGKSIPGAMFMMRSKAAIKSLAESGLPPAEVFSTANEKLCEGNDAEMFLTAWMDIWT